LKRIGNIPAVILVSALSWLASCRDAPRDNPFDPEAEILLISVLSPPDSSVFLIGETIDFRVSARAGYTDQPAGSGFLWESNISGLLSEDPEFSIDSLAAGTHQITVTVEDSLQGQGSTAITVTVKELDVMIVRITNPPGDTVFLAGGYFKPAAEELIPEGTTISGRSWQFGEGSGISDVTVADPDTVVWNIPDTYSMIYRVVDTFGRAAADTATVTVLAASEPPRVKIVSPAPDTTVTLGDSFFLKGMEWESTSGIAQRKWVYPVNSGLETVEDTVAEPGWRKIIYPGSFMLFYLVTDFRGAVGRDSIIITVSDTLPPPPPPVAEILSPQAESTITEFDSLYIEGRVTPDEAVGALKLEYWNYGETSGIAPDSLAKPGWRWFTVVGVFTVSYIVRDTLDREDTATVLVTVEENRPPKADIIEPADDMTILQGQSLTFSGSAEDTEPGGRIASHFWTWGDNSGIAPDSTVDTLAGPGSKIFPNSGTFIIRYIVLDNLGAQGRDSVTITVAANQVPTAEITSLPDDTTITAGDSIPLVGTGGDPDGTPVSLQWSYRIDPDPPTMLDPLQPPAYLILEQDGTYWVYLTVTDSVETFTTDSVRVVVEPEPFNFTPTASILVPSKDTVVVAWSTISFLGEDDDEDGEIVFRRWSNGASVSIDTLADTTAAIGPILFKGPGVFRIKYTVTDDRGASYTAWRIVTVQPNNYPTANIVSPSEDVTITVGGMVTFAALDSDPGGEIVLRVWDYGANSGIPPDSVAMPAGNRIFNNPGTFTVIYTVTDNLGISRSDSVTVIVKPE